MADTASLIESGPVRIFATVNGMSTRLPDGGRQLIGGWSQDSEHPRAIEYVRADVVAGLATALSEMLTEFASARHPNCGCASCKIMAKAEAALKSRR